MLVETISFEIHNFHDNTSEQFLVQNTIENQEMIFANKFTRQIKFIKTFSFQYEREVKLPKFMIETLFLKFISTKETEYEIDDTDEMVGAF